MAESTGEVTNTFSILADPIRRYVLNHLDEQETPVSFDRLTTWVVACSKCGASITKIPTERESLLSSSRA